MIQLYITSTTHTGFYFAYDPVTDKTYEGTCIHFHGQHNVEQLQTQVLHDAFINLTNTKALSRHELEKYDILCHAPVAIYIENDRVRSQFKAPWKYEGLWKTIAQKRRKLKYFEQKSTYHINDLPEYEQETFNNDLHNIEEYVKAKQDEIREQDLDEALDDNY